MFAFSPSHGQVRVISAVLSNLAAGWFGTIVILPGIFGLKSITEFALLLTYSLSCGTLAIVVASKLEDNYL